MSLTLAYKTVGETNVKWFSLHEKTKIYDEWLDKLLI